MLGQVISTKHVDPKQYSAPRKTSDPAAITGFILPVISPRNAMLSMAKNFDNPSGQLAGGKGMPGGGSTQVQSLKDIYSPHRLIGDPSS